MKKTFALLILLTVSFMSFAVFAQVRINSDKDKVTFKENRIFGDSSAANGITVSLCNEYDRRVFWNTDYSFGETAVVNTEFKYYLKDKMVDKPRTYEGFLMYTSYCEVQSPLYRYMESLLEELPEGESKNITVKLSDWYEYVPFSFNFDFESFYQNFSDADEQAYTHALSDYFKIPVIDSATVTATISKNLCSTGSLSFVSDFVDHISSVSTLCNDACYFAINREDDYEKSDMSYIRGGNGIYKLPYDIDKDGKLKLHTEQIETVFFF